MSEKISLCKYKHNSGVFIIITIIKICHNFLLVEKISREKAATSPNKKFCSGEKTKSKGYHHY